MKSLIAFIAALPPKWVSLGIAAFSAFSLLAALTGQYVFGLLPCFLCLLQRIPFSLNVLLGLGGFWKEKWTIPAIVLSGISFLTNAGIAFYHSGVERKWWVGLEGCTTPDLTGSVEEIMARLQNTDVVRCDEIPWEMFGLSMANYNVLMCLGLGCACFAYLFLRRART